MMNQHFKQATGFSLILGYLGITTMLAGGITLLPLFTLFFYPEEISQAKYFIIPGILAILIGYILNFYIRGKEKGQLQKNQDMVIVLLTWIIAILVSAFPFVLSGNYSFTQAIFEATSGLSTTGFSIIDIANTPNIFFIHRSILLFFGGIGLVLIMTSVLSDVYGMRLYHAEGHADRLMPNLLKSARMIILIYSAYITIGVILYIIAGMSPFDAINHAISAVSTGGFSTKVESIGYYNDPLIEWITIVLMILGSTNFLIHLMLIQGKFQTVLRHCETKFSLGIFAVLLPLSVILLFQSGYTHAKEAFQDGVFQFVSALSTTGLQTIPTFSTWPASLIFIFVLLMLIGGSTGSTAGGLKQYRVYIVFKEMIWYIQGLFLSHRVIRIHTINRYGKMERIDFVEKNKIFIFILLYLSLFAMGTFIFTLSGASLEYAMFEFSSAIGNVGLSIGVTNSEADPLIHWTAIIGMFVGRLEIYIVFLGLIQFYREGKAKVSKR